MIYTIVFLYLLGLFTYPFFIIFFLNQNVNIHSYFEFEEYFLIYVTSSFLWPLQFILIIYLLLFDPEFRDIFLFKII